MVMYKAFSVIVFYNSIFVCDNTQNFPTEAGPGRV